MKIIFLTFIVTLVSLNIFAQNDDRKYLVEVGDIAPDFEMAMPDGTMMKLSALRGKVVMLQFTASWCGVCRKEMPFIESEIWQKHKENPNFALYGIDRDEPAATVIAFAKKTGVTYPIGLDPKARIFELYAEKDAGITRNVIIGKDGRIVMLTRLYDPEEFKEMVKVIDNLLAEK
ncbi:TlpA family protein disulfide reductase [Dysgonomonas sp. HGC4]|uniref:TlpA family protein disulfide reductase n=1 Tax=Dysgonomonas sp. HGC4 TaxID=1658009 RepID=UPI0006800CDF|nr:TlpA disulfide reductase family protein [Dysgonomonas sp. HGC4]MBD8348389.1 TlpA family protein disulfide reductase [Dysgonomonas sp. HGC4]